MAINTGVNDSKLVGFAPLGVPVGVDTSKLVAYAVILGPIDPGVTSAKLVAYAVLNAINTNAPVWPSTTLPDGYVGVPYSQSWNLYPPAATPVIYSLASGTLPPGTSLTDNSFSIGTISGTPTTIGIYSFTIRATNAYGTADIALSITVTTASGLGGSASFVFIS